MIDKCPSRTMSTLPLKPASCVFERVRKKKKEECDRRGERGEVRENVNV